MVFLLKDQLLLQVLDILRLLILCKESFLNIIYNVC
jgi:hypothetical protein